MSDSLDFSMMDQGDAPVSKRARAPIDPERVKRNEQIRKALVRNSPNDPAAMTPGEEGKFRDLEDRPHGNQHILYDPAQENTLDGVTDPDGTVTLHHYTDVAGHPSELMLDPDRLGQNPWSKAEKRASAFPKTFFYTNPADKESFLSGKPHYTTKVPAKAIYDMTADKRKIVSRLAARGGFNINHALNVLKRAGYKGVFYSGSFPTVAMLEPTKVKRVVGPERLSMEAANLTPKIGPITHGDMSFTRHRTPRGVHWVIEHGTRHRIMAGPQFVKWVRELPPHVQTPLWEKLSGAMKSAKGPQRLARSGYGYCFECKAPFIRHDKKSNMVHCPNGHKRRYLGRPTNIMKDEPKKLSLNEQSLAERRAPLKPLADDLVNAMKKAPEKTLQPMSEQEAKKQVAPQLMTHHYNNQRAWADLSHFFALLGSAGERKVGITTQQRDDIIRHCRAQAKKHKIKVARIANTMGLAELEKVRREYPVDVPPEYAQRAKDTLLTHLKKIAKPKSGMKLSREESSAERMNAFQPLFNAMVDRAKAGPPERAEEDKQADQLSLEQAKWEAKQAPARAHALKAHAYFQMSNELGLTGDARANGRLAGILGRLGMKHMKQASDLSGTGDLVPYDYSDFSDKEHAAAYEQAKQKVLQLIKSNQPTKLAALRAPTGGTIINNQYHKGGQILPKAFKRISRVVAAWRSKNRPVQLARIREPHQAQGYVSPDGEFHQIQPREMHWNLAQRLFPEAQKAARDPRRDAEAAGFMHVGVSRSTPASGGGWSIHGFHPEGKFTPQQVRKLKELARELDTDVASLDGGGRSRPLRLARPKFNPEKPESVLSPEDNSVGVTSSHDRAKFESQLNDSISNRPGTLPTLQEIKTLAQVGESTKGQYEHAGRVLASYIGKDNAKIFTAANAILSPLAGWEHHSRSAMRLIRLWREAGSPRDEASVHNIVERLNPSREDTERTESGDKMYPSIGWGSKAKKLKDLLSDPEKFIARIENVAATKRGKIVDFGRAFFDPTGVPIDTHMAKLTTPELNDVQTQLRGDKGDKDSRGSLRQLVLDTKNAHLLTRAITQGGDKTLSRALLDAQKRVIDSAPTYKAYKVAIAHAAKELGWEPRQVQETVWSAIVSIIAAKNANVPPQALLQFLRHENAFEAWNVGGLLSTPEMKRDVSGLSKGPVEAFVSKANRPPAKSGAIEPSDTSSLEAVTSRIPRGNSVGAWVPIEESIRNDPRPPF